MKTRSVCAASVCLLTSVLWAKPPAPSADRIPPKTSLALDGSEVVLNGRTFIPPDTSVRLEATDQDTQRAAASGVRSTFYRVDTMSPALFSDSVFLPVGFHLVEYYSVDNDGNREAAQSMALFVDGAAPQTRLVFSGAHSQSNLDEILDEETLLDFAAEDTLEEGSSTSGVSVTLFRVNGGEFEEFTGPFSLPPGDHAVEYASVDNVGNQETTRTARLIVRPLDAPEAAGSPETEGGPVAAGALHAGQTGPDPTFRFDDVYVYPNPAGPGKDPTVHVEVGAADQVRLALYDIAGTIVGQTVLTHPPQLLDDGRGPRYAYEHSWNASDLAPGTYVCAVTAEKDGRESLRRAVKLAVIK